MNPVLVSFLHVDPLEGNTCFQLIPVNSIIYFEAQRWAGHAPLCSQNNCWSIAFLGGSSVPVPWGLQLLPGSADKAAQLGFHPPFPLCLSPH